MKKTVKLLVIWILLYFLLALISMWIVLHLNRNYRNEKYSDTLKHIGEKIEINNLIDFDNNKVKLQCKTDITIIDFWFKGCAPCLEHMEQYAPLILGKENKITVVSISIEDRTTWKPLFEENSPLPFLTKKISNWEHYTVADTIYNESETKIIKTNGSQFLMKRLGVKSFPFYMVLDKNGILIDIPINGVDYIKQIVKNESEFRVYWAKRIAIKKYQTLFLLGFAAYSIIYWLVVSIFLVIQHYWRKRKHSKNG